MIDIVIITVPEVVNRLQQAAPALLKASVESHGFTCSTIDYNARFYHEVNDTNSLETYFSTGLNTEEKERAEQLVESWAKELIKLDPEFVGISVFTYQNRIATELFCRALKRLSNVKIILGGQGLSEGGILGISGFGKLMFEQKLADFWIRSEGEISLVELLKGNYSYPGINSDTFQQIDNLDSLPFPDYSDYQLDLYDVKSVPITGSRGCVRACSFCDIHDHWKYRYRSGRSIAEEIIHQNKKHQITHFNFSDSLINGSLKEFNKFTKIITDHNKTLDNKITWRSQFIVRSKNQVNDEYWENIARSGGGNLAIGVETGSDGVRAHMNKKFSNEDLDYTMSKLQQYNITCIFLMIVGYPTETDKDFQDTLDMFTKYKPYANQIIVDVAIGSTLGILPGTPLHYRADEFNIVLDKYENNWMALDNPDLTLEKRLQRREKLKEHLISLGYKLQDNTEHMMKILNENLENFNQRTAVKKMMRLKNGS